MSSTIVIKEVEYSTHASQGETASGEGGYDIWLKYSDGWMDFLGFITPDRLNETIEFYEKSDTVDIRYLSHD